MRIRVLDLDGSVRHQAPIAALVDEGRALAIDMRAQAPYLRILARRQAMRQFGEHLMSAGDAPGRGTEVTFYGSGDFHHLSAGLVARFNEPLTVIHIDNHPDWINMPPTFNCGAWVNRALELPQVEKIITLGPCSDDMRLPELKGANLGAVRAGKLELFPWVAAPSRVFAQAGARHINWRNLAHEPFDGFLDDLVKRITTKAIYVSIDKDALTPAEATTNWDQGQMRLAHITQAFTALAQRFKVLGVDVCGDYSAPSFADPFRATLAYFDHPPVPTPTPASLAINARTNGVLIDAFRAVL